MMVCPHDGQQYDTEEYGQAHPDAVLPCGCWLNLHPDGNGGFVVPECWTPANRSSCSKHTHCDQDELLATVEFHDEPIVLVPTVVKHDGEMVEGWATKQKPVDFQFALLMEQRKTNTLLERVIAHTHDNTELLVKLNDYFVQPSGQDDLDEWKESSKDWFINEYRKKGFSEEDIQKMLTTPVEYSDFALALKDATKRALKEIAEEAAAE